MEVGKTNTPIKNVSKNNDSAVLVLSLCIDMIMLCLFSWIFICVCGDYGSLLAVDRSKIIIFLISYLVTVSIKPPMFYVRNISGDKLASHIFWTTIEFVFVSQLLAFLLHDYPDFTPWQFVVFYLSFGVILLITRLSYRISLKFYRASGHDMRNVVLVGSHDSMLDIYDRLTHDIAWGYDIMGYFDDKPSARYPQKLKYLGKASKFEEFIIDNDKHIDEIYCGLPDEGDAVRSTIKDIIGVCEKHVVRFYSVPNLRSSFSRSMVMQAIGDVPVFSLRPEPLKLRRNKIIKRIFDVLFSLTAIICLLPIYIIVAAIIKCTSPGPVFFRQKRHGLDGKEFDCLKFRSMKVNKDSDNVQATKDDPRKYPFGDFMRRTSIDELPQFFNVLMGDMSVIGPRPHMLKHTEMYSELIDTYMVRHFVKPGITGWAQVNGCRGETKELWQMEARVKKDIWYLEHWSLWLDLFIIYLTVKNVVLRSDDQAY